MIAHQMLEEVVTLPEAVSIARKVGYPLDRSNLLRYARSGRLIARKSQGTWLTTRVALQALIVELATQARGRPRAEAPDWADVQITPGLAATLEKIDDLRARVSGQERLAAEEAQLRRNLTVEAIYHTNRIEGNPLSLAEVRAVVEAFWAEQEQRAGNTGPVVHE